MSLYDDDDLPQISSTAAAPGWSQGVKLLQTQLQLKKASQVNTPFWLVNKSNTVLSLVNTAGQEDRQPGPPDQE